MVMSYTQFYHKLTTVVAHASHKSFQTTRLARAHPGVNGILGAVLIRYH